MLQQTPVWNSMLSIATVKTNMTLCYSNVYLMQDAYRVEDLYKALYV